MQSSNIISFCRVTFAELGDSHLFEQEACRSLLAMFDSNRSGVLESPEVRKYVLCCFICVVVRTAAAVYMYVIVMCEHVHLKCRYYQSMESAKCIKGQ